MVAEAEGMAAMEAGGAGKAVAWAGGEAGAAMGPAQSST